MSEQFTVHEWEGVLRGRAIPADSLCGETTARYVHRKFSELAAENEALRKALGGMLFAFDDGVGLDWLAELLDHARKLCPAAEFKA
jgi:hypothetical protein